MICVLDARPLVAAFRRPTGHDPFTSHSSMNLPLWVVSKVARIAIPKTLEPGPHFYFQIPSKLGTRPKSLLKSSRPKI